MTTTRSFLLVGTVLGAALSAGALCFIAWPGAFRWFAVTVIVLYTIWESGRCLRLLSTGDDDFFGEIQSLEPTKTVESTGTSTDQ